MLIESRELVKILDGMKTCTKGIDDVVSRSFLHGIECCEKSIALLEDKEIMDMDYQKRLEESHKSIEGGDSLGK